MFIYKSLFDIRRWKLEMRIWRGGYNLFTMMMCLPTVYRQLHMFLPFCWCHWSYVPVATSVALRCSSFRNTMTVQLDLPRSQSSHASKILFSRSAVYKLLEDKFNLDTISSGNNVKHKIDWFTTEFWIVSCCAEKGWRLQRVLVSYFSPELRII